MSTRLHVTTMTFMVAHLAFFRWWPPAEVEAGRTWKPVNETWAYFDSDCRAFVKGVDGGFVEVNSAALQGLARYPCSLVPSHRDGGSP